VQVNPDVHPIAERLAAVLSHIAEAERKAGRPAGSAGLVAVSKNHPASAIREAFAAGQRLFGENRVQELLAKAPELPGGASAHLIGHLQTNKIRKVLPHVDLIHAVDSLDLALDIERVAGELGLFPRVLLEVNVSGEASKFGFAPDRLEGAIESLLALNRVQVEGLMTIAPYAEDPDAARPYFAALRSLRDRLAAAAGTPLPTLSMGMSGDYPAAIAEGATLVRIGTAIFGERPRPGP